MPAFTVIAPTLDEAGNVAELHRRIRRALGDIDWELIFVDDDSSDGTADVAREIAQTDRRVRCVQRIGRRGLAGACMEGVMASSAPIVAVIDADLQHDEQILPRLYESVRSGECDVAVASRYVQQGGTGDWSPDRARASRVATRLAQRLLGVTLADPMSGCFAVRRDAFAAAIDSGLAEGGFKILLDLLAVSEAPLRVTELPYVFRARTHGASKLDTRVLWEFVLLLLHHRLGGWLPRRFIGFALVGGLGVLVHLGVLSLLFKLVAEPFVVAQAVATMVAMTVNFLLNNALTFSDRRLRGWGLLKGWLSFAAACSVGAIASVGIAERLYEARVPWLLASACGLVVGAVWNYAATSLLTWGPRRKRVSRPRPGLSPPMPSVARDGPGSTPGR